LPPDISLRAIMTPCPLAPKPTCALMSLAALTLWCAQAAAADPAWVDPQLVEAAKKEGTLVIYSSINEEEGLPIWKRFEEATGVKIEYVRGSDAQLIARMLIEMRAGRGSWDLVLITAAHKLPPQMLAQIDPPEAQHLFPAARDANRRWYGFSANYNVPAYNTNLVKPADLPKSYEELAKRGEWSGRAVVNEYDSEWVMALLTHYGEDKGRALLRDIGATLKPAIVNGHLAVARAVGSGEYAVALTNYVNLTLNVKLAGAPTDFWALDPIGVFYMQVSANTLAPHPNAARLGANFILSAEGQSLLTRRGRIPARPDVETNPPGVLKALHEKKVMSIVLDPEQEKRADAIFKESIAGRRR
jgi:iron(III) transport system substrate-binding protein